MKYAFTRNCFENYEKEQMECVGKYDIPLALPPQIEPTNKLDLIRFDFSKKFLKKTEKVKPYTSISMITSLFKFGDNPKNILIF